jgi:hypothetical protein
LSLVKKKVRIKCLQCGRSFDSEEEFKAHRERGECGKA